MESKTLEKLSILEHFVPNNDGWLLHLKQVICPQRFRKDLPPFVIVPGYGMNSFVFGYHPKGDSMQKVFAEAGFEFWSVDMRWQGQSRPIRKRPAKPSLLDFVRTDLPAAIDHILASTRTERNKVILGGCSLGGTIAYSYLALSDDALVDAMVAMGSPLRWVEAPIFLRAAAKVPRLTRLIPTKGTAAAAPILFPILGRVPFALNIYANPNNVDRSKIKDMAQSVSDPNPTLNEEIARWVKNKDLMLRGVNITEAMQKQDLPLLLLAGNKDGIVPVSTATFAANVWGGADVQSIEVGTPEKWYAHADMFIGNDARQDVYEPILSWLMKHYEPSANAH